VKSGEFTATKLKELVYSRPEATTASKQQISQASIMSQSTVTTLDCPNGSKVFVVGTAHFSQESIEDVRRTIIEKQPRVVMLELCSDRRLMLQYSQENILQEARTMTFAKMRGFIRRDGLVPGIVQSIFLKFTAELTQQLGMAPGGEFRAGYEEARKIEADIILGDRLVGITFKRVLASLSFWRKLQFTFLLLRALTDKLEITPEEVEQLKSMDMVQLVMGEVTNEYPEVMEVLVNERDRILTHSLMVSANCAQEPYGPPVTVVGVMGIGHMRGVASYWMNVGDIRPLLTIPKPSLFSMMVWSAVKFSFRMGLFLSGVAALYYVRKRVFSR
jgi:pheromone shutdown protein TraB